MPCFTGRLYESARSALTGRPAIPRYAWSTRPVCRICARTSFTVFDGTAKPMPTLPVDTPPVSICVLTPMTCPRPFSSGPPELPWLIGASVWMTWSMVNWFGALIRRWSALTIPAVAVRSSPNGLPIATTGSPTSTRSESPSWSGFSAPAVASTRSTARSVDASVPTISAATESRFEKLTRIASAPSMTWKFVTMFPALSTTKPDPSARRSEPFRVLICTTPRAVRS